MWITHEGVYGVILRGNSLLLIKKYRGPYAGKLDLPGGKMEPGETEKEALIREVREETGIIVRKAERFDAFTVDVEFADERGDVAMHHVGHIYRITDFDDHELVSLMCREDSLGAAWYSADGLREQEVSPFVWRAIRQVPV